MEKDSAKKNSLLTTKESWEWQPEAKKIQKIPVLMRQDECNKDAYDPKVVSFGPYHHGKPELQLCEDVKQCTLQYFVKYSDNTKEHFLSKVLENIANFKSCYIEGSTDKYTKNEFAEMMLLDACFLIFFMDMGTEDSMPRRYIFNRLGMLVVSLVNRDILLMENQVPFQLLKLLISLIYKTEREEPVFKFLHQLIWGGQPQPQPQPEQQQQQQQQQQPPLHLFEAVQRVLVWDTTTKCQENIQVDKEVDFKNHHKTFRSARDLKAKGIEFKPTSSKSLESIKFNHGKLELPTWFVTCLSRVLFLNMIAYELCPSNIVYPTVISYINFMKSLIESPGDVKELREKRILLTSLGSDKEVVGLYRGMNTYGMNDTYSFMEAKKSIQNHYDSKAKTWIAELKHTYLSSPWSLIGWFAGVFLLVLTFTQTYFTVNPPPDK